MLIRRFIVRACRNGLKLRISSQESVFQTLVDFQRTEQGVTKTHTPSVNFLAANQPSFYATFACHPNFRGASTKAKADGGGIQLLQSLIQGDVTHFDLWQQLQTLYDVEDRCTDLLLPNLR
jgi:hypothetical protein